jgi:RND family efflux transporter MFP subunit
MKKIIVIIGIIGIFGLILFTLLNNRAQMQQSARKRAAVAFPVTVATVSQQEYNEQISQAGLLVANSDVAIVSQLQGQAIAIMVQEGSYVSAGSPITKLEDQVPEANFLSAQTSCQKARKDWERSSALHKDGLISDAELESARLTFKNAEAQFVSAQKQYHNSMITSPIAGIITSVPISVGTMVNQGMIVANVVDISKLKVMLNVGEQDAFKLKPGDQAVIETDVYPGIKFYGKVENISAKGDEAHTYPVKIVIPNNKQYPLKSGMFGRVSINLGNQTALTIPRDALLGSIQNAQVFVVENEKAKLQDIRVGSEIGTNIVIFNGLEEGQKVVTSGQYNLKDNSMVMVEDSNAAGALGARRAFRKGFREHSKK